MTRGGDENRASGLGSVVEPSQGNCFLSAIGNGSPSTPVEKSLHPRNSPLSCGGHPRRPKATSSLTLTSATLPSPLYTLYHRSGTLPPPGH